MLKHLKDKADRVDRQIKGSPIHVKNVTTTTTGLQGNVQQTSATVPVDGITSAALHNQFIGNWQGFVELINLLNQRKADLEDIINQERKDNPTK